MLVAALDTSTLTLSCAVLRLEPGRADVLARRSERPAAPSGGHGPRLPGTLVELLGPLGLTVADVEGWAVGLGPGSFTGLRVGLATWKGLAYGRRRPIAGVSGLAAMAAEAAPLAPPGALLVPVLDARKGEVFAGFYRVRDGVPEPVAPEVAVSPAALPARLPGEGRLEGAVLAFGEGFDTYRALLAPAIPGLEGAPATPAAEAVARLAGPRLAGAAFDAQALYALEPHYIRPSEAEVKFPHGLPAAVR
jgi:tRNA threonylcarbamoyladenosine biosynthesis protein TsaB